MIAHIFPGQGSQFPGMGKELYETNELAKALFEKANSIIGFRISDIMFSGTDEDLKQTKVTQPAIFLHSVILPNVRNTTSALAFEENWEAVATPEMVAGHSLGEFSALVSAKSLSFEDGLKLVIQRANAMQRACESQPSTMAAIIGLDDKIVEEICAGISGEIVVPANYNCPGQLVISGSVAGIGEACKRLTKAGARMAKILQVGGAFHSPLMEPARKALAEVINSTHFDSPICPIYQNVNASPETDPVRIKANLIMQLTSPVRWSQSVERMIKDGATSFIEVGPGKVLQGLVKKINRTMEIASA